MRNTPYATEIKTAEDAFGQRIERLYIKEHGREEIRFSWWKDGNLMIRPLDLPEGELLPLMRSAISDGVFSDSFICGLHSALEIHLNRSRYDQCLANLQTESRQAAPVATDGLLALLGRLEPIDEDWPDIDDPPPESVKL